MPEIASSAVQPRPIPPPPRRKRERIQGGLTAADRVLWDERFMKVRDQTRQLFSPLTEEDAVLSVTEDTSPPKWHLAHTTWFFERFLLKRFIPDYQEVHPEYDYLFNSYYQTAGSFLPKAKRGFMSRPSVSEVLEYRMHIEQRVVTLLHELGAHDFESFREILEIGMHHEQQHQELLLMDVKRNFYENPLRPPYLRDPLVSPFDEGESEPPQTSTLVPNAQIQENQRKRWQLFEGGLTLIGASAEDGFSYDHERGQHRVWVQPFEMRSGLVTNGEYLEFIEAGGYENPGYWLSDGWNHVQEKKWNAPLYWEKGIQGWRIMTLYGMKELDLDEPVSHLSFYEAQAFAHWKGCRLPTEFEWEAAARQEPTSSHYLENEYYHPSRGVTPFETFSALAPAHQPASRLAHLHGTLWEWTQSAYLPYPGYQPLNYGLSEYNEKFMINQMVMRGGSCITPREHYRLTYRNFFYPWMRWQFSGLRLVRNPSQ